VFNFNNFASSVNTLSAAPKVYSYTRWSTPEQAKGDSLRRQTEAAAKWAARRGLVLDESLAITDEGRSAYRGGNAEGDAGLSRFLEACRRGLIEPGSFLLVESLDRISRMAPRRAQRLLDDIVDAGVAAAKARGARLGNLSRSVESRANEAARVV
jgi:DNA invertase Pin-like site-specific DNA recombinase